MDTLLVTGGAGFIGGNFVRRLMARGRHRVVNLDALTYAGNLDTLAEYLDDDAHVFVHGDIADRALVDRLLAKHRPRAIINFAAESHVDRSIEGPAAFVTTNVVGTLTLLESALAYWRGLDGAERDSFRFLHVSTDEVYGSLGPEGAFREDTAYAPNSPYAASKAGADHLVRAFHHTYGLPTLTTNCSNNYGPYQFPEKLIPLMIHKALAGEPLPVYGDGLNVRDWLFVPDHCDAIARVLEAAEPGDVFNIGGNAERTNIDVVQILCRLLDDLSPRDDGRSYAEQISYVDDRPGHDRRYAIDASHIRNTLDWRPAHDFESGLESTVRWYLDNQGWVGRVMDGSYRGQRLGSGPGSAGERG